VRTLLRMLPALLLASTACADIAELVVLRRGLSQRFPQGSISINLTNGTALRVVFVNSAVADQPEAARARTARQVAEYVRDNFSRFDSLQTISVGFTRSRKLGPVRTTSTDAPYSFTPAELRAPRAVPRPDSAAARPAPN
jgi:hypothetical protein